MKKSLLAVALVSLTALAACEKSNPPANTPPPKTTPPANQPANPPANPPANNPGGGH